MIAIAFDGDYTDFRLTEAHERLPAKPSERKPLMSKTVFVHLLPSMFEPAALTGGIAVIADILRASTTITHALANGAKRVIPCGTVDEALDLRRQHTDEQILLGGERGGLKIEGFDLSNSPDDYDSATVTGKSIGFTTTNGTKALLRSSKAKQSVI